MARSKKSTIAEQIKTAQAISRDVFPVRELNVEENGYFTRLVQSREVESWSSHDLALATQLAVIMRQSDQADEEIQKHGFVLTDGRKNPAVGAKHSCVSSIVQLTRLLGLSASQKGFGTQQQRQRNLTEQRMRQTFGSFGEGSDLIPTRRSLEHDDLI